MASKEYYLLRPDEITAETPELGQYIEGYTDARGRFSFQSRYLYIAVYQNGFIQRTVSRKGQPINELVYYFDDFRGMRHSVRPSYGRDGYINTYASLQFVNNTCQFLTVLSTSYDNEYDESDKFNMEGHAINAIINAWKPVAERNFKRQMEEKGYATFISDGQEVQVGEGFLRTGHDYVSGRFHYDIDDKYLFIQPDNEEGSHFKNKARPFKISIDKMFDLNVFLTAITDLLGIR